MMVQRAVVSVGIAGSLGAAAAELIAPAVERAGFHALWVNDTPGADSLEMLSAAARVTDSLTLATGVVPVDRRSARDLADDFGRHALPTDRVILGIGSGRARQGALALMRNAARVLREQTGARVVVGALGPRMRRLAAEESDGVVLNWLTPAAAADQAAEHHDIDSSGRVVLYVRTAFESAGRERLEEEAARYGALPNYAANFERLGATPLDTVLPLPGVESVSAGLASYTGTVDEVVLRAMTPTDGVEDYLRFIVRARDAMSVEPS